MWRTKDFDEVGRQLQRLRGNVPNGNLFAIGDGKVQKIADRPRARAQALAGDKPAGDVQPSLDLFC